MIEEKIWSKTYLSVCTFENAHRKFGGMNGVLLDHVKLSQKTSCSESENLSRSALDSSSPYSRGSRYPNFEITRRGLLYFLFVFFLLVWLLGSQDWLVSFAGNIAKKNYGYFLKSTLICFNDLYYYLKIHYYFICLVNNYDQCTKTYIFVIMFDLVYLENIFEWFEVILII